MRFKEYLDEAKKLSNTMIGFGLDKGQLRKIYSYIKSWLESHDISYDEVKNPHFTIAMIPNVERKDELIRKMHKISKNITFKPKSVELFQGQRVPKDFIAVEYRRNKPFMDAFFEIAKDYVVNWFPGGVKPHTSLFVLDKGQMTQEMFDEMKNGMPSLPTLKPKELELWNRKFEIEFKE